MAYSFLFQITYVIKRYIECCNVGNWSCIFLGLTINLWFIFFGMEISDAKKYLSGFVPEHNR
jgi:hypothetical protein